MGFSGPHPEKITFLFPYMGISLNEIYPQCIMVVAFNKVKVKAKYFI